MRETEELLAELVIAADRVLANPCCEDPDCCMDSAKHRKAITNLGLVVSCAKREIGLP